MYKLSICFSGGGVRGAAHLGVLKAFGEHGIQAEAVSGASAGALSAAFYAAGHSPDETFKFLEKIPFYTSWNNYTYQKPGLLNTDNFCQYFEEFFPENSFESLELPCFINAADLISGEEKIFSEGELITRILASCAFPFVFTPVKIDNRLYSDGGIVNNFPIEPLKDKSSFLVGIYVNPLKKMTVKDFSSSWKVSERALIIRSYVQSLPKFEQCDLFIMPEELGHFNIFDKRRMKKIFDIGYEKGKYFADILSEKLETLEAMA